jgi:hypothetical protein
MYSAGAGGKFLSNCLALSMKAEFQHRCLLGKFNNSQEKFDFINGVISKNTYFWDDCGLGCRQLLGVGNMPGFITPGPAPVEEFRNNYMKSPTLEKLTNGDNLFFLIVHTVKALKNHMSVWPRAKIIQMTNAKDWLTYRNINGMVDPLLELNLDHIVDASRVTVVDTLMYFDTSKVVDTVRFLYEKFNLTDFNETYIRELHQNWTYVLGKIKSRNQSNV